MKSKTKEYRAKYWRKWKEKNQPDIIKICSECKKVFKQTGNTQKRCEDCMYLECKWCKKKFIPPDSQYKKKYCCKKCYSDSMKGKPIPPNIQNKNGRKPRTYHKRKRPKHGGAIYDEWRMKVWKRNNFTCQFCGKTSNQLKPLGIKICADHIKPYCNYPELRYEVSNGRTLCIPCHKTTETYGSRARKF